MDDEQPTVPHGYCHCGCGQRTKVPTKNDRFHGRVKGQPLRFIHSHNAQPTDFESYYQRGEPDECWEWQGSTSGPGKHGQFSTRKIGAHRVAYERAYGPIPEGLYVCHRCDNPLCVNPAHLWVGTQGDNMRDMWAKGRGKTPTAGGRS